MTAERSPRRFCVGLRSAAGAALLCALSATATAQTVSGIGARECSAFTFALERDSDAALDSYVAWAQGFISAFNWANARRHDVRIDAAGIINALGTYCAANPGAGVYTALQELIRLNSR